MDNSRYIIGIDLGTTNIAVTFIDTERNRDVINVFSIPQLSASGECSALPLLPAFFYKPGEQNISPGGLELPWNKKLNYGVGLFAREFGCDNPSRFVSSSKSWLCHAGVDRKSTILPWNNVDTAEKFSPVEVTQAYLEHVKSAWDHTFRKLNDENGDACLLESQQVLITIPASFDETARELTIEAAERAGYKDITLLEEPLAVFYSWLNQHESEWKEKIVAGETTLVVDIGGGTTDFSIIELSSDGVLSRTVAGEHLLLGGDNVDIALAKQVENHWGIHLKPNEWTALCQQTRKAKELLLSDESLDEAEVILLSKGSSLIGNMRKSLINREDMNKLLFSGFFPEVTRDSDSLQKKSGIKTMGLPYAADPAVTKHLLDFLRYAGLVSGNGDILQPDKILFNGGSVIPKEIQFQLLSVINSWFTNAEITQLPSIDLTLAVAYGASYCGKAKRGIGVKVKSGTSRSYYIEVDQGGEKKYICIMPRGCDESILVHSNRLFSLQANHKVSFPLYSSSTRINDKPGHVLAVLDHLTLVSELVSVMKFGNTNKKSVDCELTTELTETGVLKVFVESKESDHCWPLHFDTRLLSDTALNDEQVSIDSLLVEQAKELIRATFLQSQNKLPTLISLLEKQLGLTRKEWSIHILREFADTVLAIPYSELKSPKQEARWLNLCGFCLRPGFGDPADELRLKKVWKLWFGGQNNKNDKQVVADWWVFWRRVASGLRSGHQRTVVEVLMKSIWPKGVYAAKIKEGPQAKAEMWRCVGALELLTADTKIILGKSLVAHLKKLADYEFWALARLGSRRMFRAKLANVVSSSVASKWLEKLIEYSKVEKPTDSQLFAISRLAAVCGDRLYDLEPVTRDKAKDYLNEYCANKSWVKHLESEVNESREEQAKILGDALPLGLALVDEMDLI